MATLEGIRTNPVRVADFAAATMYVSLSDVPNAFRGQDWVSVQVWWDSFNALDGNIVMCERNNSRIPVWVNVPNQAIGITTASGSHIFQDVDFAAAEVSFNINKGTATTGNIYWYFSTRQQHGTALMLAEKIDKLTDKMDEIVKALKAPKWAR